MKKRFTEEQIVGIPKYADMAVSEVKRLKELERENEEMKKIIAEQVLDIRMLNDVNAKKW